LQYIVPDKRMIAVLGALVLFGIGWRVDTVAGIGLLIVALPYPRGTVFGSTDLALVLLLLVIWLLRVSQRHSPPPPAPGVDLHVVGLVIAYILSFYNIANVRYLGGALDNLIIFAACLGMFYLIVNNVRRPEHLALLHTFQTVSIVTVCLLGLYELRHP